MKKPFFLFVFVLFFFTLKSCDLTVKDEDGKEVCLDDYLSKVGKDRSKIEAEAKSRNIEASAVLLEIYSASVKTSDILFDCTASEYYNEISEKTSGKYIKTGSTDEMIQEIKKYASLQPRDSIDLVFLIDGTGSMTNDIDAVKSNLSSIISTLSGKKVNISIAVYRDKNVDSIWYERNQNNFVKSDSQEIVDYLSNIEATGGGDFPESLFDAAYKTISELDWTSKGRIIIAITDASPLIKDKTQYTINDVINICIDKKVLPFIILAGLK